MHDVAGRQRPAVIFARLGVTACLCAMLTGSCRSNHTTTVVSSIGALTLMPPEGLGLRAVELPDFSRMEDSVEKQMRERLSSLKLNVEQSDIPTVDLAAAYGEMGKLLMAGEQVDAAEACYLNAQTLAPGDRRWPYYLGHLFRIHGSLVKSAASFERALTLEPRDVATLVWLGEVYLAQGRAQEAESIFARALVVEPGSVAARFGTGRAALARKQEAEAAKYLEDALAHDPRETAAHYPLAMAYRNLGDAGKAQAHLRQQGNVQIFPTDPLMKELDELLQSPKAFDLRGGRALDTGDWQMAAAYFQKGLDLAPSDPALRFRLATALFQMGKSREAIEQFEEVVRISPGFGRAHYSLGVLMEAEGRQQEALDRFTSAVRDEPTYIQARVGLGGALRRSGRLQESLAEYRQALNLDRQFADAIAGYSLTLVRLRHYREARDRLAEGLKLHPDQPLLALMLARLLAAAPDAGVRDGRWAMAIVHELLKKDQSLEIGETLAMTTAELGDYQQAAAVQRNVIAGAERAGNRDLARHMAENLQLYERRQPCRTPWRDGEMP